MSNIGVAEKYKDEMKYGQESQENPGLNRKTGIDARNQEICFLHKKIHKIHKTFCFYNLLFILADGFKKCN
jgi:hypothetical protein